MAIPVAYDTVCFFIKHNIDAHHLDDETVMSAGCADFLTYDTEQWSHPGRLMSEESWQYLFGCGLEPSSLK